jgi:hypothetical protein
LHSWYEPILDLENEAVEKEIPLLSIPQGKWFSLDAESENGWWKKFSEEVK